MHEIRTNVEQWRARQPGSEVFVTQVRRKRRAYVPINNTITKVPLDLFGALRACLRTAGKDYCSFDCAVHLLPHQHTRHIHARYAQPFSVASTGCRQGSSIIETGSYINWLKL